MKWADILRIFLYKLKARVYADGYRPPAGSLLYSPSLALIYSLKDNPITWMFNLGPQDLAPQASSSTPLNTRKFQP